MKIICLEKKINCIYIGLTGANIVKSNLQFSVRNDVSYLNGR